MKHGTENGIMAYRGRLIIAAALLFALLTAVLPACTEEPTPQSGVNGQTAATAAPANAPEDEWSQYVPSGSGSNVETPYVIPADKADRYSVNSVVFGPGIGGEMDRDPFVISFLLPTGWRVERTGSVPGGYTSVMGENNPLKGTVFIYESGGACVATIGFSSYYMDYDPIKNYYQIYSSIVYGEYRFMIDRSYHPFYNSDASNITAITQTCYAPEDAAARFNPAVVAHDPERGVFIAVEFQSGRIDPIQLLDFAESLRIY